MTTRKQLVLAAGTFADTALEEEHLAGAATIRIARLTTPAEVAEETQDTDAVIVTNNPLPAELVEALGRRVRVIARAGIGLDAIDLSAAGRRGIAVINCPDYATAEVATHAAALILTLNRRVLEANDLARADWTSWPSLKPVAALHEQTLGVVGCGRIGSAVVARMLPFFRSVACYDPVATAFPPSTEVVSSLDELLCRSNVVTLHLPLSDATRGLLGDRELSLLPAGAIVVNVSRGGLVDESALLRALDSGHLAGAGLDVLEHEPPALGSPLLAERRLILTPHVGWYSEASEINVRKRTLDGVLEYLNGEPLRAANLVSIDG